MKRSGFFCLIRQGAMAAALAFVAVSGAKADIVEPEPPCTAPQKPQATGEESVDGYRMGNFEDEVEEFLYCIEDFIKDQQEQMQHHQRAVDKAKADWKRFEKRQLKRK